MKTVPAAETQGQQFLVDNMSAVLRTIINGVPISKCTSIATGEDVYPKIPDNSQCVRIPVDDYVFMVRRSGDSSFVLTAFVKMFFEETSDFMSGKLGVKRQFDGTRCRSVSAALVKDMKDMDDMNADGALFVTPAAEGLLRKSKSFKQYRGAPDMRDGVVLTNIGKIDEHQVFRVAGVACEDPDYKTPELYWLEPMFSVSFEKKFKKGGVEVDNSVYWMLDDLFFELYVMESIEWIRNSGIVESSVADDGSNVAVAMDEDANVPADFVVGDRIRVIINDQMDTADEDNREDFPKDSVVFTKEQVGDMDHVLQLVIGNNPVDAWITVAKEAYPEFLRSMDGMVVTKGPDGFVSISAMDTGDETIFVLSEMTDELEKRRCRVFHESDFANWSLCRVRMKRVADKDLNLIQ